MRRCTMLAVAGLWFLISGCAPRPIGSVLADPSQYSERNVRIAGRVVESYSVLGNGAYRVQDDTGGLWVVSQSGVPRQGADVTVEGRIEDGFDLEGLIALPAPVESGIVMVESSHESR